MDFDILDKYPYSKVIGDVEKSEILFSTVRRHDREKVRMAEEILRRTNDWDIFAVWIHSTDTVNHLFGKDLSGVFENVRNSRFFRQ